ncbi:MAG TPA: DUF3105 domain-containing protein [Candidatus Limnocylindrales bacterium]
MSKESRRAARAARESRRLGTAGAGRPTAESGAGNEIPVAGSAASTGAAGAVGTRRPAGTATRAGRRERVRRYHEPTFLERYRTLLIGIAGVAILAVVVGVVFLSSTAPVYACSNIFDPSPTPTVSPGSSTRLGFPEEDMGNSHVVSRPQKYLYCPPASGNHLNVAGAGPIAPRVYKPTDNVGPPNWVHNLEHGGLIVLYRGDSPGATAAGLAAFQDFYNTFPASPICKIPAYQISPVIARFDDMPHPYALLVWDRVFYLDTWDPAAAIRFFNEEAERLDKDGALVAPPENASGCVPPSASPGPSNSAAPSVAPSGASAAPSGASAAPSTVPSSSPQPSPSAS